MKRPDAQSIGGSNVLLCRQKLEFVLAPGILSLPMLISIFFGHAEVFSFHNEFGCNYNANFDVRSVYSYLLRLKPQGLRGNPAKSGAARTKRYFAFSLMLVAVLPVG